MHCLTRMKAQQPGAMPDLLQIQWVVGAHRRRLLVRILGFLRSLLATQIDVTSGPRMAHQCTHLNLQGGTHGSPQASQCKNLTMLAMLEVHSVKEKYPGAMQCRPQRFPDSWPLRWGEAM